MRRRARIISLALLLLALATPVLFLAGYAINGPELFSRATPRVVVALIGAGLGAAAAAYLALAARCAGGAPDRGGGAGGAAGLAASMLAWPGGRA